VRGALTKRLQQASALAHGGVGGVANTSHDHSSNNNPNQATALPLPDQRAKLPCHRSNDMLQVCFKGKDQNDVCGNGGRSCVEL
jgi:hypothetical protein